MKINNRILCMSSVVLLLALSVNVQAAGTSNSPPADINAGDCDSYNKFCGPKYASCAEEAKQRCKAEFPTLPGECDEYDPAKQCLGFGPFGQIRQFYFDKMQACLKTRPPSISYGDDTSASCWDLLKACEPEREWMCPPKPPTNAPSKGK